MFSREEACSGMCFFKLKHEVACIGFYHVVAWFSIIVKLFIDNHLWAYFPEDISEVSATNIRESCGDLFETCSVDSITSQTFSRQCDSYIMFRRFEFSLMLRQSQWCCEEILLLYAKLRTGHCHQSCETQSLLKSNMFVSTATLWTWTTWWDRTYRHIAGPIVNRGGKHV